MEEDVNNKIRVEKTARRALPFYGTKNYKGK